jgi:predicted flap endonuclease-1-like 5' DNA nuclease
VAWFLGQSAFVIVVAFVLGLLVGWLLWGRRRPRPAAGEPAVAVGAATTTAVTLAEAAASPPAVTAVPPAESSTESLVESPTEVLVKSPAGSLVESSTLVESPGGSLVESPTLVESPGGSLVESPTEVLAKSPGESLVESPTEVLARPPAGSLVESPTEVLAKSSAVDPAGEPVAEEPVAAVEAEPTIEAGPPVAEPVAVEPVAVPDAPDEAVDDDLERVEGIGPKMAGALRAGGIHSYRQLADADQPSLRAAIERAGLRFAPSLVTWAQQARHLADGDESGFTELTDRLVAGRDVGRS